MGTRCIIRVCADGKEYRIYRQHDGYPKGVLADIWVLRGWLRDPEYFLANFIFYAKLTSWLTWKSENPPYKPWEYGYGVCSKDCKHTDLEYEYIIRLGEEVDVEIRRYDWDREEWSTIFKGTLTEAVEVFNAKTPCHIDPSLIS